MNPYLRVLLVSFLCAAFYGIGLVGPSEPEPDSFVLPAPVGLAVADDLYTNKNVKSNLIFLLIWWTIIGSLMYAREVIKRHESSSQQ